MQELIALYNKAIEYYSAVDTSKADSNNGGHEAYLQKLQSLFKNEELQKRIQENDRIKAEQEAKAKADEEEQKRIEELKL